MHNALLRIYRVTSTADPRGRLVRAPNSRAARQHVINGMGVEARFASQDELMEAGKRGVKPELAGEEVSDE